MSPEQQILHHIVTVMLPTWIEAAPKEVQALNPVRVDWLRGLSGSGNDKTIDIDVATNGLKAVWSYTKQAHHEAFHARGKITLAAIWEVSSQAVDDSGLYRLAWIIPVSDQKRCAVQSICNLAEVIAGYRISEEHLRWRPEASKENARRNIMTISESMRAGAIQLARELLSEGFESVELLELVSHGITEEIKND